MHIDIEYSRATGTAVLYTCMPTMVPVLYRAQRPSPADVGKDQTRNKKLQIHACAHKRVSVFTVINHRPENSVQIDAFAAASSRNLRGLW